MIRKAEFRDLNQIVKIYNQAIIKGHSTADTEVFTLEQKLPWFQKHYRDKTHPLIVYTINDIAVGWGSISHYREGRKALEKTVEVSYYIQNEYQNQGIGKEILGYLIDKCKEFGFKNIVAILLSTNTPSIKLLNSYNFTQWGFLPDIAIIEGETVSHIYMGLKV